MILGPSIAPVIGGYTAQYLGWRWIFYLKTIIGGVLTILTFIFVKETLYRPGKKQKVNGFKGRLESLRFNPVSDKCFHVSSSDVFFLLVC
jgi:MFS family permease